MTTGHQPTALAAAVRQYAARARASLSLDEAGPVSYAGLWLLLASLAPSARNTAEFHNTFGLSTDDAAEGVGQLLEDLPPNASAALGAWVAKDITLTGPLPLTLAELPSQATLDAWACEKTRGLIDTFPLELEPDTLLVLASALVLTPRWSGGVHHDDADDMLHVTRGLQAVVATSVGPVAVVIPPTEDAIDVVSVIAAPAVPAAQVWVAVDEVIARLDTGKTWSNTFPDDMSAEDVTRGHAWASHETMRTFWGDAPDEGSHVWETRLPWWTATTSHDLTDAPGVALVAEPIQAMLPEESDVRCVQGATAAYDEVGFSAAAVTAMDFIATGMPEQHLRTVRQIEITFDRPHAVIAIARGGAWDGIPLFHTWVTVQQRTTDDD